MPRVSAHIVVSDAASACRFYEEAFGAREVQRVPLPDGGVMTIEIEIGKSRVHLGSEFPDAGMLSPLSIGGTATVLQIDTDDADELWNRAVGAGAEMHHPLADQFWGERHGQLSDPSGTAGTSPSASASCPQRSSLRAPRRRSAARRPRADGPALADLAPRSGPPEPGAQQPADLMGLRHLHREDRARVYERAREAGCADAHDLRLDRAPEEVAEQLPHAPRDAR